MPQLPRPALTRPLRPAFQHLAALLACDQPEVVDAALGALSALVRRSSASRGSRWHDSFELSARLQPLATGLALSHAVRPRAETDAWASEEPRSQPLMCLVPPSQGLGLLACATLAEVPQASVAAARAVHHEFYQTKARSSRMLGHYPAALSSHLSLTPLRRRPATRRPTVSRLRAGCASCPAPTRRLSLALTWS